ncbi:MAG TPA: membrane protein insertase YidC [Acidimicrobiales bacterium]|nr:membrane protein insertase YidC [Acidimicrobiales bacterium]
MSVTPVLASTLGQIFEPLYSALAWLIAIFYALIPNYAIAIALLTITVMAVTAPLTIKSTRSMLAMQRLAPEMKKLQAKYKGDKVALNEEMTKLYREHGVNPLGGCLPLLIQFPVFFILYGVIRGLTNTVTVHGHVVAEPRYIGKSTKLYASLTAHPGEMKAFGINLADTLFSHQAHWYLYIPFAVLILIAIGLQYLQMYQMNKRNPAAAQANPQMQAMQKYMPLIFAVIYIRIAAAINIYFIVSTLCRIGLQTWTFRTQDTVAVGKPGEVSVPGKSGSPAPARKRSFFDKLADLQQQAVEAQKARQAALQPPNESLESVADDKPAEEAQGEETSATNGQGPKGSTKADKVDRGTDGAKGGTPASSGTSRAPGSSGPRRPSASSNGGKASEATNGQAPKNAHPRSKSKRTRKAR